MRAVSFIKEIKHEMLKVKWPSLKEVSFACMFVMGAAGLSGLFFLLVDSAIYKIIKILLRIGG